MAAEKNPLANKNLTEIKDLFFADSSLERLLSMAEEQGILGELIKCSILKEERQRCGVAQTTEAREWRQKRWGDQVDNLFIEMRPKLEKVSFWKMREIQKGVAMERYYQLSNGEVTMETLSRRSGAVERYKSVGVMTLSVPLAKTLRKARPGVPQKPVSVDGGFLILQLEEWIQPALDQSTHSKLLVHLEDQWVSREIARRVGTSV